MSDIPERLILTLSAAPSAAASAQVADDAGHVLQQGLVGEEATEKLPLQVTCERRPVAAGRLQADPFRSLDLPPVARCQCRIQRGRHLGGAR